MIAKGRCEVGCEKWHSQPGRPVITYTGAVHRTLRANFGRPRTETPLQARTVDGCFQSTMPGRLDEVSEFSRNLTEERPGAQSRAGWIRTGLVPKRAQTRRPGHDVPLSCTGRC